MLHNTFIHIPGIGEKTEKKIWHAGIHTWPQWKPPLPSNLPQATIRRVSFYLDYYQDQQNDSASFYASLLPPVQIWRLFPHFRNKTAFLDIETNGMPPSQCEITTIALYDGHAIYTYVQGDNLEQFVQDIKRYEVIVTYNGKNFDIPIIESYLHTRIRQVHIDLRFILAKLGYKGGLKGCEKQLGIDRQELNGVDGFWAVLLWRDFIERKNKRALKTLLAYNIADAVNLEPLMIHAYNLNIAHTPFSLSNLIPLPQSPPSPPFCPDMEVIKKIRQQLQNYYK